jgi:hypothetical protein
MLGGPCFPNAHEQGSKETFDWMGGTLPTYPLPQMTWGQTLKKALICNGLLSEFTKWRELAANRDQWRVICGSTSRHTKTKKKAQLITSLQAI